MTGSHFDVFMVLLGVRRLIVQRLENKKKQTDQTVSHSFIVHHIVKRRFVMAKY